MAVFVGVAVGARVGEEVRVWVGEGVTVGGGVGVRVMVTVGVMEEIWVGLAVGRPSNSGSQAVLESKRNTNRIAVKIRCRVEDEARMGSATYAGLVITAEP